MSDTVEITIPPNAFTIRYADTGDEVKWTFHSCTQWVVDNHPRFNQAGPGIRQGARILDAIRGVAEGEKAKPLGKDDCKAFSEAMEEPATGYHPPLHTMLDGKLTEQKVPARQFITYLDAVAEALK